MMFLCSYFFFSFLVFNSYALFSFTFFVHFYSLIFCFLFFNSFFSVFPFRSIIWREVPTRARAGPDSQTQAFLSRGRGEQRDGTSGYIEIDDVRHALDNNGDAKANAPAFEDDGWFGPLLVRVHCAFLHLRDRASFFSFLILERLQNFRGAPTHSSGDLSIARVSHRGLNTVVWSTRCVCRMFRKFP